MKIIADTHTHTLANDHAYSTLTENAVAAHKKGLQFLCYTEHTQDLPGCPSPLHFMNLTILPRYEAGVMIVRGAELNIKDEHGTVDLAEDIIKGLEWVIASLHPPVNPPKTKEIHTKTWLAIAENPYINVIGHCGDGRFEFDYETVIKAFAKHNKIVEINSHSFGYRVNSKGNCEKIAELCMEHGVPIVVSSDAHHYSHIGDFGSATEMLTRIGFPEELILNADEQRFLDTLHSLNGGKLVGEQ